MTTTAPPPAGGPDRIRPAERADLLGVVRIERAAFPEPWPYQVFEGFLGDPGFLIAERGTTLVGYVVADAVPNHGRPLGHVKDLAVHPDHRRRGHGSRLLARALSVLLAERVDLVKLEVRESNERAMALYRQFGFEPRRLLPRYYGDGEDAIVLVADLAG